MTLTLSIVEFNTKDLLRNCLSSIFKDKLQTQMSVWVVDNASTDGSAQMVKKEFPLVKLIENKENLGFGKAHNLVFTKVKSDYYLVLNSDTKVGEGVIDGMVDFMKDNPDCGIASCKVLGFDGRLQPNGGDLPFGLSLLGWLFNLESFGLKEPAFHRVDEDYYKSAHEVGWVSGNFMIVKKEVFEKIGLFSEDYFMYFEDVELCFRVKKAGFSVMINPEVYIKHLSGGSLDDPKFRQWSGEMSGLIQFYKRHFDFLVASSVKILVYFSLILRVAAFALERNFSYSKTYAKVIFSI